MARLIVSLLLVPCVLLTQLAAVPHAHGAETHHETSRETRPHIHFHLFSPVGLLRESAAAPNECSAPGCVAPTMVDGTVPWDHDADAVYVEGAAATAERDKQIADELRAAQPAIGLWRPHDRETVLRARPRSDGAHVRFPARCPLYVRFLALTI